MSTVYESSHALTLLNEWKVFGGHLQQFSHPSSSTTTPMRFSIFLPSSVAPMKTGKDIASGTLNAQSFSNQAPALVYLSGLTCTDENVCQKAHPFQLANELGLILVAPDTSPRGANLEGEEESYDVGTGAGFYLTATKEPYKGIYNMDTYITQELWSLLTSSFPIQSNQV